MLTPLRPEFNTQPGNQLNNKRIEMMHESSVSLNEITILWETFLYVKLSLHLFYNMYY